MNLEFQLSVLTAQGIKNLQDMDNFLKTLRNTLLTVQTQAERTQIALAIKDYSTIRTQMAGLAAGFQNTQSTSSNAAMALMNLNYVIRDSPYFFNNFALGLLAVGNNLNPLIDSFMRLRMEAGTNAVSTMSLLRNALVGGAGISIAFSVAVTAIQAFVFQMAKAKKETGETAKEIDLLAEALKRFIKIDMPSGKTMFSIDPAELQKVINETQKQLDDVEATLTAIEMKKSYGTNSWNDNLEKANKETTKSKEELEKLKKILQEDLDIYKNELRAREILGKLGVEELNRQKEKTKELKRQKDLIQEAGDASIRFQRILADNIVRTGKEAGLETYGAGRGDMFGADARPSKFLGATGQKIKESMKEFQVQLEMAKIASQELGKFLADAFINGKFALDSFISSLVEAIAQMLILKAITNAFSFGMGGSPASAITAIPASLGLLKTSAPTVIVGGEITMDSNKFVVSLKKANNSYSNNYEVGRGNIINL